MSLDSTLQIKGFVGKEPEPENSEGDTILLGLLMDLPEEPKTAIIRLDE